MWCLQTAMYVDYVGRGVQIPRAEKNKSTPVQPYLMYHFVVCDCPSAGMQHTATNESVS